MLLSDRLRAGSECAPWVIEEVRAIERQAALARIKKDLAVTALAICREQRNDLEDQLNEIIEARSC